MFKLNTYLKIITVIKSAFGDLLITSVPLLIRDAEQMAPVPNTAGVQLNNIFPPSVTSTKYFTSPPLQGRTGIAFRRGSVMCYRVVGAEHQVYTADLGHREERYLKSIGLCFCFQCRIRKLQRIHAAVAGLNQHNPPLHCPYLPIVLSTQNCIFSATYFQDSLIAYFNP